MSFAAAEFYWSTSREPLASGQDLLATYRQAFCIFGDTFKRTQMHSTISSVSFYLNISILYARIRVASWVFSYVGHIEQVLRIFTNEPARLPFHTQPLATSFLPGSFSRP